MRVIISAGGTGGHIYPALAIIDEIKKREENSEFLYIGTHNRMEKEIVPSKNIPFKSIEIYGINRKNVFKNIKTLQTFIKSYKDCKRTIKAFKPDIVIGVGGYVTGPVLYAASKMGYKTMIHEQNSIPGKCNLFLSKHVSLIATSFKSSNQYFPSYKTVFTGNPCSQKAKSMTPINKRDLNLREKAKLVLIVMGSLGSEYVTKVLKQNLKLFSKKDYDILFVTGTSSYDDISKEQFPSNVHIVKYIEDLPRVIKVSDLIISRAGASTLSEIIALKVPSILIPSPYVPDNHQYKNALDLVNADASILIEEKALKGDIIVRTVDSLLNDEARLKQMQLNLEEIDAGDSASAIYDNIKSLIDGK